MLLSLAIGCGREEVAPCPSFAEMTVEDPGGLVTEDFRAIVADAIADFAAWTGREGVCVPAVELREELQGTESVDGVYRGRHDAIRLTAEADPRRVTLHELCHALDAEEGISEAHPDLFPYTDVEESEQYPTERARSGEAFARACDAGGLDIVLARTVLRECADETDASVDLLAGVVYPWVPVVTDSGFHAGTHEVPFDYDAEVVDIAGIGGEIVLLLEWTEAGRLVAGVSRVDRSRWTADKPLVLGYPAAHASTALASSEGDAGAAILPLAGEVRAEVPRALRFDLNAATVEPLPGVAWPETPVSAAWLGETLVVSGNDHEGPEDTWVHLLRTWPEGATVSLPHVGHHLSAHGDEVVMLMQESVVRWDGEDFAARRVPWLELGFAPWADGRFAFAPYPVSSPVPLLYGDGDVFLPEDPCSMWDGPQPRGWANLGTSVAILGSHEVAAGGSVPITLLE